MSVAEGINALYASVAQRKACCAIRKIEPLNRALQGVEVWITGLQAAQSAYRSDMQLFEWDESRNLLKFNPLLHWSLPEVRAYIAEHAVPYLIPYTIKAFLALVANLAPEQSRLRKTNALDAGGGKALIKNAAYTMALVRWHLKALIV